MVLFPSLIANLRPKNYHKVNLPSWSGSLVPNLIKTVRLSPGIATFTLFGRTISEETSAVLIKHLG